MAVQQFTTLTTISVYLSTHLIILLESLLTIGNAYHSSPDKY